MAQNACQQMELTSFYQGLRNLLSTHYNNMNNLVRASEFLNTMDATTATNMGMDTTTRDDIAELRVRINAAVADYDAVGGLKEQINLLRYI